MMVMVPVVRRQATLSGLLFVVLAGLVNACATIKPIRPPVFQHEQLVRRFLERERLGHYALTAQRGWNVQPAVTATGAMFYTSNLEGSTDIWLRDLNNTVNVQIVAHDAEQHSPSVTPDGRWLVFVSEDRDPRGRLRLFYMKAGPGHIIKAVLDGVILPNFWEDTQDLSARIQVAAQKLEPACRAAASEKRPAWSPDGKFLYYVSDRCTPRQFGIWRIGISEGKPTGPPQRLTKADGDEPAISGNGQRLAYTAVNPDGGRALFVVDLASGNTRKLALPVGNPDAPNLYSSPALNFAGDVLFYSAVFVDTNNSGFMDPQDDSSVFRLELEGTGAPPKRMLEGSFPIAGISFAPFLKGAVLYAAGLYGSINIYLMPPEGIIPREGDIFEQYRFTQKYRAGHVERYLLALDAVQAYWGHLPEFVLYEGRLLLDRSRRLRSEVNRAADLNRVSVQIRESAARNPFTALLVDLDRLEAAGRPTARTIAAFVDAFPVRHARFYSASVAEEVLAASLETLALAAMGERSVKQGHAAALRLVRDFPRYSRRVYARFLLARIELRMSGTISPTLIGLAAEFARLPPRMQEGISAITYNAFYSSFAPKQGLVRVERELKRADLPEVLQTSLNLARSRLLYDLDRFDESIAVARSAADRSPPRSGSFVRAWQSIAFASEKLGRYADAYDAKLRYGGAYSEETGAQVSEGEYLEIIEEAERQIDTFVRTARSLSAALSDADLARDSVRRVLKLDPKVRASGLDREMIRDFCRKDSQSWRLMTLLGRTGARYVKFCAGAPGIFAGKEPIDAEETRTAVDLLYTGAYGAAARLNIMFLHMRSVELFPDLYRKRAIYYHRLKVDLAIEHSGRKLAWEEQRIKLLDTGDLQSVLEVGDPFDSTAFDALADGYRFSLADALRFDDMSLLYGYAYTLVRKSVQREEFYDRLARGTLPIRPERLADYKLSVLRDLKTAEYYLRYIVYRRPNESDAYLLLGWLQQYVDDRRGTNLIVPETFLTGIVQYITGTKSATPTDGRLFKDLYDGFFSERLYEANVELYRQALERTRGSPVDQANLNLNLANNYFKLLNFKHAVEHYNLAADQMKRTDRPIFRDYVQEALFHYNRGRALFYQGESAGATSDFERAYNLYDQHERKPLFEEYSRIRYEKLSFRLAGSRDAYELLRKKEQLLFEKVRQVNFKMALASAMLGLSKWESGQYARAVDAYEDAENRLYGGVEPPPGAVARSNLRNFIALALQDQNRFVASDQNAEAAGRYAQKRGLAANRERFEPESIISRLLGCLLNYGEDFSVIGEGRNPFGFSPLRSYELSLGIRLENRILQGDLEGAEQLLDERRSLFKKEDSSVRQGRLALLTTANTRAFHQYQAGRFLEAFRLFGSAAEEARGLGFAREMQLNLRNRVQVLFVALDRRLLSLPEAFERLQVVAAELAALRSSYSAQARVEYIKKQKPGFEFTPVHEKLLEESIQRDLGLVVALQGMCHYYRGLLMEQEAKTAPEVETARREFQAAITALSEVSAVSSDARPEKVRLELNIARAELRMGRLHAARARLLRAQERAFEFGMVREEWAALEGLSEAAQELGRMRPNADFQSESLTHARAAVALLKSQPHLFFEWLPRVTAFYDYAAKIFIQQGLDREALLVLEQKHQHQMQSEYLRYPLRFADPELNSAYRRYRTEVQSYIRLRQREALALGGRADLEKIRGALKESQRALEADRKIVIERAPGHAGFLGFSFAERPVLARDTVLFRLHRAGDLLHVWFFEDGASDFVTVEDENAGRAALEALRRFRKPTRAIGNVLVIADERTFTLPLKEIIRRYEPAWPAPVYLTRMPDQSRVGFVRTRQDARAGGQRVNVRVARQLEVPKDYEAYADVVSGRVPGGQGVFPVPVRGRLNVRLWFERPRPAAVIVLQGRVDYTRAAGLYEALHATGASTVIFSSKPGTDADTVRKLAGKERYTEAGGYVFGSAGYSAEAVVEVARIRARERLADGERSATDGQHARALEEYSEAASLAAVAGDRTVELEARLRAAERRTLNSGGKEGRSDFDGLLAQFGASDRDSARIHRVLLRSFYRANQAGVAEGYLKRLKGVRPAVAREVAGTAEVLAFLNRLVQLKYSGDRARFADDFREILPDLIASGEAAVAVEALTRRTLYSRAIQLARAAERTGDRNAAQWIYLASREAQLIGANAPLVPPPPGLTGPARLLSLAEQGRWPDFDRAVSAAESEVGVSFALIKFRRRLYEQWKRHSREESVNVQDIADVAVDVGVTAYQRASSLERSILLAMLLRAVEYDPELQTAQNLRSLIKAERRVSLERAARMSLMAARRLLMIADPLSASAFLLDYEQYSQGGLPEAERPQLAARTGAALQAAGLEKMVTSKAGRKKLAVYQARWARALAVGQGAKIAAVYRDLPKKFTNAEIDLFNRRLQETSGGSLSLVREWTILAGLLKQRAVSAGDWAAALDAAFFGQSVLRSRVLPGASRSPPRFIGTAEKIRSRLPIGQSFTALVDTTSRAYRLRLQGGGQWSTDVLALPGRYLRGRLLWYLETQRLRRDGGVAYRELAPAYRALFPSGGAGIRYFWFEGVHAFAPIPIERGDRIYQVLDPEVFAREEARVPPPSYAPAFEVRTVGAPEVGPDARWSLRQDRMEILAMGEQGFAARDPLHVLAPLKAPIGRTLPGFLRQIPRGEQSYFLSGNRLNEDSRTEVAGVALAMSQLAAVLSAPGILVLRQPAELAHPYFVRYFYDRSFPAKEIDKRYVEATLRLRRVVPDEWAAYGYRLVTSRIIKEPSSK